jgi:diguanylate cyclase (GGDEF)-like protein/putative nucleotidyltransferase with HDIG domain
VPISVEMFGKAGQGDIHAELDRLRRRVAELEAERARVGGVDELTGVLSAKAFRGRVVDEVSRTRRSQRPLTLAILTLDDFAAIEASQGFSVSDQLLTRAAQALVQSLRQHDLVGRTGNHEFAIMLPETTVPEAEPAMRRVLSTLEGLGNATMSAAHGSVGVTAWDSGMSAEALLLSARRAAAQAEREGGGQIVLAGATAASAPDGSPEGEQGRAQRDAIEALVVTLTERDGYTGEHSEAVVEMSAGVARNLGLRDAEVDWVRSAALLHDIGKVAIPDEILHKPGPLNDEEWVLMKQHPVIGERILRVLPGMGPVARIVRHEHERWDGNGYPDGLAGEDIPIGSRIIIAADTYHAITSDRPYRAARSHEEAVEELTKCAGSQFDPAVTGALIGYLYGQRQMGRAA